MTVNLVVSKSVPSDDAERGIQDEKFPESPAEQFKAELEDELQEFIKEKLQEYEEKGEPEFQKFAEKAKPIADAYSGWVSDKWQQTIDAGMNGFTDAKALGKETVDANPAYLEPKFYEIKFRGRKFGILLAIKRQ